MNFAIPKWLHVTFAFALAGVGVVTALTQSGQLQVAAPLMSLVSLVALVVHSVDPTAVGSK